MGDIKSPRSDMQLFSEGAAGEAAEGAGWQAGANGACAEAEHVRPEGADSSKEQGKSPESERAERFRSLIEGEFRDLYENEVRRAIKERLSPDEEKLSGCAAEEPESEPMRCKHGMEADEREALGRAGESGESCYEDGEREKDLSAEEAREIQGLRRDNELLRREMQERKAQAETERALAEILRQEQEVRRIYPDFDLKTESQNGDFVKLLNAGVSVQAAYEVVHKDEIISSGMRFAAQETARKLSSSIASGARRPDEGGIGASSAARVKSDVRLLTKEERREIARRAARGERIVF